jgi:radical SAM superfamily enzyme YgiQ (UPF0313 family)
VATLEDQACQLIANTGYEEISLTSLSSGDYPDLMPLIDALNRAFSGRRVSLSLPSLRIDSFAQNVAEGTSAVRKSGLTFAPEAGTQRLRDVVNKGVSEEDLLRSVSEAFDAGHSSVKLYFMIGLPTETDEDLLGIADLAAKVVDTYYAMPKEKRTQPPQVSISVSPFVPKPFTPFQWEAQATAQEIRRKQLLLKDALKTNKRIKLSTHDANLSVMEAVFARGDRRLAPVLLRAFELGARMDGWGEHFNFSIWEKAMKDAGLDIAFYANRERGESEAFPYDHIDCGVSKDYLKTERARAKAGVKTPDCRTGCTGCGMMERCGGQI